MTANTPASRKAKGRRLQQAVRQDLVDRLGIDPGDVQSTAIASLLLIADREGVDISDSGAVTTWILDQCGVQPREVRELCTFFTWSRGLDNLAGMTPLHEVCQSDGRACPLGVTCPIRERVLITERRK